MNGIFFTYCLCYSIDFPVSTGRRRPGVLLWSQVIRFQIPGTDPGFAEAFENYFGRPYDEKEAEAVYSKVGEGPQILKVAELSPKLLIEHVLTFQLYMVEGF